MTNRTNTRRALIFSIISTLICLSMLIGSTFAWFTDTVSTGVNKIEAGNLDMEVMYKNSDVNTYTEIDKDTNIFKSGALWEPGHAEVVNIKIKNAGSLVFKYNLAINIAKEVSSINVNGDSLSLSNYIKFAIIAGEQSYASSEAAIMDAEANSPALINAGYTNGVKTLAAYNEEIITIVVYMPTTVGNEANYKTGENQPEIDLGISVVATQAMSENDSFGSSYDKDSVMPEIVYGTYVSGAALSINGGANKVAAPANSVVKEDGSSIENGTKLTLSVEPTSNTTGIQVSEGEKVSSFDISLVTENNEKVKTTGENMFTVEINIGAGRNGEISLYHNGKDITDQIESYDIDTGVLTFKTSSFSPYTVVEGVYIGVDTSWYNAADKEFVITTADQLAGLAKLVNDGNTFANKTVKLGASINLYNLEWTPIGTNGKQFKGHFDGQNHTISNLYISGNSANVGLFGATADGSVKNVTVKNANVSGYRFVGALIGSQFTASVSNCHVVGDITVIGTGGYVAALSGHTYGIIDNCSVIGTEGETNKVESKYWGAGAIAGHAYSSQITGVTVKNMTVVSAHYGAGGVAGYIAQDGKEWLIKDAVVENCDIDVVNNYDYGAGYIAGCTDDVGSIVNPTVINTTANTPSVSGGISGNKVE